MSSKRSAKQRKKNNDDDWEQDDDDEEDDDDDVEADHDDDGEGKNDDGEEDDDNDEEDEEEDVDDGDAYMGRIVPDDMLKKVMDEKEIPEDAVCLDVDVTKAKGSDDWMEPPRFWTGESMRPTELVTFLFPNSEYHGSTNEPKYMSAEEAGLPKSELKNPHEDWKGKRERYEELINDLENDFKRNSGLDVGVLWKNDKKDYRGPRWLCMVCKNCKSDPSPIVRLQLGNKGEAPGDGDGEKVEKQQEFPRCYYLVLHEVYFHCCKSQNKEGEEVKMHKELEKNGGGKGYVKLGAMSGLDKFRDDALGKWIGNLHRHKNPSKNLPEGDPIVFPKEDQVLDNRRQVVLEKKVPDTINLEFLTRYMAWHIYRIVNELHIVEEFTKYLPRPLSSVEKRRQTIKAGCWPLLEQTEKPLHLYVAGVVLLFGGMAMVEDKKGKRTLQKEDPKKRQCLHQAAHTDFSNGTFQNLNQCELLYGLVKPFAVNIAVEDERSIYVGKPSNTICFKKNELMLVGGDTVHGGVSYIFNPDQRPVQYHPSLHFVFGSRRFKQDPNKVSVSLEARNYLPACHAVNLNNEQLVNCTNEALDTVDELAKAAKSKKGSGHVGKLMLARAKKTMKALTEMFGTEAEKAESKKRKRT